MTDRHTDALQVNETHNVAALVKVLQHAVQECQREGVPADRDPAVQLMVHRLNQLTMANALNVPSVYENVVSRCAEETMRVSMAAAHRPVVVR